MKTYFHPRSEAYFCLDWDNETGWKTIAVSRDGGRHFVGLYWVYYPWPNHYTKITDTDGCIRRITESDGAYFVDDGPLTELPYDGLPEGAMLTPFTFED